MAEAIAVSRLAATLSAGFGYSNLGNWEGGTPCHLIVHRVQLQRRSFAPGAHYTRGWNVLDKFGYVFEMQKK